MSDSWQVSVVLITSSDPNESHFGTGFVIDKDEQTTYLLTCTHIIRDVGGPEKIEIYDTQARVIDSSPEEGADLAVLRIEGLLDIPPLPLYAAGKKGKLFSTAGFQFDGKRFVIRGLHGNLGEQVGVQMRGQADRLNAWDLEITDTYLLQPGYSGSPVVDEYDHVLGVVNTRRGEGKTGVAISIEALKKVWPSGPPDLVKQSGVGIKEKGVFAVRLSRRTVVAGLCILTALGVGLGGSLTWLTHHVGTPTPTNAPMFGFDPQRTHLNPNEQILSTKNVSSLVPYWTTPDLGAMWGTSPVVANGLVYVTGFSHLEAFYASTRDSAWSKSIDESPPNPTNPTNPTVANGQVYVGSNSGKLYAFDASTGTVTWTFTSSSGSLNCSPAVVNGRVYVNSVDSDTGKLYALSATTGALAWPAPASIGRIHNSSPAVSDSVVYIGSTDGKLYAFSATTGTPAWPAPASLGGSPIGSTPAVANNLVYIATVDGKLYAFSATTGTPAWPAPASLGNPPYSPGISSPAVAYGAVYIGSGDGRLYAFNAYTGALFWSAATGGTVLSSPTVANGVVYVGSEDRKLYAFAIDNNGSRLWSRTTGGAIYSSPIVADGVVYVCSDDGKMHTFHLPSATP